MSVFRLHAAVAAAFLAGASWAPVQPPAAVQRAEAVAAARNPILTGADPHLTVAGGRWWMSLTEPSGGELYAYVSDDLRRWRRVGPVVSLRKVDWIDDDGRQDHDLWAPALAGGNGRWRLYYSVGPQGPTPSRIGVALSDTPTGPFRDLGRPLLTGGASFEAIDPMVFTDPRTGAVYLYAGGSAGARLKVFELDADMVSIRREIPVEQPPGFTEAPFMHSRAGLYYLSYSSGRWYDASYSVRYATAPSPTGPWRYRGVLLHSDGRHQGPGHHSIACNPLTGEWVIAYHRWERRGPGPFHGQRQVAIERLVYGPDGAIAPILMDEAAPPSSPIGAGGPAREQRPAPACR